MKCFDNLEELIEFYKKENMGLVWHLKYPVPREEEEAADEPEEDAGKKPTLSLAEAKPDTCSSLALYGGRCTMKSCDGHHPNYGI